MFLKVIIFHSKTTYLFKINNNMIKIIIPKILKISKYKITSQIINLINNEKKKIKGKVNLKVLIKHNKKYYNKI